MNEKLDINLVIFTSIIASGLINVLVSKGYDYFKFRITDDREKAKELDNIRRNSYREYVANIDYLYKDNNPTPKVEIKKKKCLENYRLMFLHSDDKIVNAINRSMDTLVKPADDSEEGMSDKKLKLGEALLELRKFYVKDTKLTPNDYRHIV